MVATSTNLTSSRYAGRSEQITLIGIHTMEAPEAGNTAENVANYFKTVQASAHWCVDDNSRVRCVNDGDTAWAMPPANSYSLNVELAGYAAQTPKQWDDAYSLATLDNAALCVAEWCVKYDIPVRHLTDSQIAAKEKGLAGHIDVNRVFHASDHTDPGENFPWSYFLGRVNAHKTGGSVVSPPPSSSPKPNCTSLQAAVHAQQDNQWGPDTDKRCEALIAATPYGGDKFPYGIAYTQSVVKTAQDGVWGPSSKASLTTTVHAVQEALHAMGFNPGTIDGVWGPNSNAAWAAARTACHI